ncbi:PREDICTED: uncharacterized protein LOC108539344 isoform X4 [Rhinopithecus bieti]|uniref:uncharacterized protein LOC108539344 isoform X4 n=1 Tax=Rhinopithecus bieti TaxID=61621 RepID=UPI00083BEC2C|nr:PREDICTED: uncharacterized protein LOC108539344 isoform X4 [Rhinopithecus bieti]
MEEEAETEEQQRFSYQQMQGRGADQSGPELVRRCWFESPSRQLVIVPTRPKCNFLPCKIVVGIPFVPFISAGHTGRQRLRTVLCCEEAKSKTRGGDLKDGLKKRGNELQTREFPLYKVTLQQLSTLSLVFGEVQTFRKVART